MQQVSKLASQPETAKAAHRAAFAVYQGLSVPLRRRLS